MSEKRHGLGRGLGALIPTGTDGGYAWGQAQSRAEELTSRVDDVSRGTAAIDRVAELASSPMPDEPTRAFTPGDGLKSVPGVEFAMVPIDLIGPNPRQPRTQIDDEDLEELLHSLEQVGMLQPVVVRRVEVGSDETGAAPEAPVSFELVVGERRWRAAQAAGWSEVPAIIKKTGDDDLLRDALLENLHRVQLNPLEEAAAYQQLLTDFGCNHQELAERLGRSRPQITNTLRLLKLPPIVGRRLAAGVISAGHARALLALPDAEAMERMAQRVVAEGLSVRTVEELVALGDGAHPVKPRVPEPRELDPALADVATLLMDRLETRVSIAMGKRKGRLTVEFASIEDLHRILESIGASPSQEQP